MLARTGKLFGLLSSESSWPGFASGVTEDEYNALTALINKEHIHNPWFTKESLKAALGSLAEMLDEAKLVSWTEKYAYADSPKNVLIVMAGNLPLVGFHDFICVLLSGHRAVCKLSSQDKHLLPAFVQVMCSMNPELQDRIRIALGPVKEIDAVIATGSDNSAGYFNEYFGKYPHIFRKNRTSVAVLDGTETDQELNALGKDMFQYFGLGCRNVTNIFLPEDFDKNRIFENIVSYGDIVNHHKYANNYDYNRTIYLMNKIPFLDNNFALFREDEQLFSPLSVIHLHPYSDRGNVDEFLAAHADAIQAVVGHTHIPFGKSQEPDLDDYADKIDTMKWLNAL